MIRTIVADPPAEIARRKRLFQEALALPKADRARWLARACDGDEVLLQDLQRLLACDEQHEDGPPQRIGTRQVGPYRILALLGEGGMGSVYLAEQQQPLRRQVALKVIRSGMDTAQVLSRFEIERQALAMMSHANIARVLDAGSTEDGRPFFVMEYVDGVPITEYCRLHQLEIAERVALLQAVCHGLQHAHQKGVMHRDIKPSNVLSPSRTASRCRRSSTSASPRRSTKRSRSRRSIRRPAS